MGGHPDRHRIEAGARQQRQPGGGSPGQYEGQRSRPEPRGGTTGRLIEDGQPLGLGEIANMHDQRVEARPGLGGEYSGDGMLVCRIAAKPIHGLGRERDEPPGAQQCGGAGDRRRAG